MITTNMISTKAYDTIKLGIDAHAKWHYLARQVDETTPQPVQKMDFHGLLCFVVKKQGLAREVHTCYEAGAFGYQLHRRLNVFTKLIKPVEAEERKLTEKVQEAGRARNLIL